MYILDKTKANCKTDIKSLGSRGKKIRNEFMKLEFKMF